MAMRRREVIGRNIAPEPTTNVKLPAPQEIDPVAWGSVPRRMGHSTTIFTRSPAFTWSPGARPLRMRKRST